MKVKVFISHARKEGEAAGILARAILHGCKLAEKEITCTSCPQFALTECKDSNSLLQGKIKEAKILIYLISPAFCESENCCNEVEWGCKKRNKIAFHIKGVRDKEKPLNLVDANFLELSEHGMIDLKNYLIEKLRIVNFNDHSWSDEIKGFLQQVDNMQQLQYSPITAEYLTLLKEANQDYLFNKMQEIERRPF